MYFSSYESRLGIMCIPKRKLQHIDVGTLSCPAELDCQKASVSGLLFCFRHWRAHPSFITLHPHFDALPLCQRFYLILRQADHPGDCADILLSSPQLMHDGFRLRPLFLQRGCCLGSLLFYRPLPWLSLLLARLLPRLLPWLSLLVARLLPWLSLLLLPL